MNTLTLRKYHRLSSLANSSISSLKKTSDSKSLPTGNTTLTEKGLVKSEREFLEFYINDQPLSEILDKFYDIKGSILDNWIGILGSSDNHKVENIRVKQLLKKPISDREIREIYPTEWSDSEFQWYLEKEREELSQPEVLIYRCAECGDSYCGGITANIEKTDNTFLWKITDNDKQLMFEFDINSYCELFDKYFRKIENK